MTTTDEQKYKRRSNILRAMIIIICLVAAAIVLIGCGDDDDATGTTKTDAYGIKGEVVRFNGRPYTCLTDKTYGGMWCERVELPSE